ncbi:TetR/AcrR family transcriptional regulator [Prevotella sp. S7 MS 2]|uniref:TetR/AcrR family transcriptional regulator n=1 Tax=Prevotella sp. S7 MS 2 TaxID=1287488 RepID=UPI000513033B|nr:TetR/AcrR family transcriptional regulator [Prevotella sp. S7 MS 2]KGI59377.1 TetR family transcriptional regulator [Prevotella sp. S7 MS 2]
MQKNNITTQYRVEQKEKILNISMQEFHKHGIKAVKMDDIANKLLISKRTLYELYANKEALLFEGLKKMEEAYDEHMIEFCSSPENGVMEIIIEFYRIQMAKLSEINPLFFAELHKYTKVIEYLESKRRERNSKSNDFFSKGIAEGYFRADADYGIIREIANYAVQGIMEEKLYQKYTPQRVFRNALLLFIRGLCTDKGLMVIDSKLHA